MNPYFPDIPDIGTPPFSGEGAPSQLGDLLALRRHLGMLGYPTGENVMAPSQPNLIPTPGLRIGPVRLNGAGLDSTALSVLGMLQGMPQPQGFGQNFATGLAYGLASGRARQAQARGAANEAAVKSAAEQQKAKMDEASKFASGLANHRYAMQRLKAEQEAITGRQNAKPASQTPVRGTAEWYEMLRKEAEARKTGSSTEQARLSPDEVDAWAEYALSTGKLPPLGLSANNPDRTAILASAARKAKDRGQSIAGNAAVYGGLRTSYANMRKTYDSVEAFAKTALANADVLESTLTRLVDSGSPIINKPIRDWGKDVQGDIGITAYNAARRIVAPEFARLLTSANASGVLSDAARAEVMSLLPDNATANQVLEALSILKTEVGNRRDSFSSQLNELGEALIGVGQNPVANPSPEKPAGKSLKDSWDKK